MRTQALVFFFFCVTLSKFAFSQGCSDPGICTIGSLNSGTTTDTVATTDFTAADMEELMNVNIVAEKFNIGLEGAYGLGDRKTNIYSLIFRSSLRIKSKILFSVKVPYTSTMGVLGSASAVGDITFSLQNTIKSGKNIRIAYTLGIVIPSNNSNIYANGKPLPMAYQTSLGSVSSILGLTLAYKNWNGAIGYQHNFSGNTNEFTTEKLVIDPKIMDYDQLNTQRLLFETSRNLKRGSDLFIRFERRLILKKVNVLIGVLPIFRLSNSTIQLLNNTTQVVKNSNGLTLNLTAGVNYTVNSKWRINFNLGAPIITRTHRPDGLTRTYVLMLGVTHKFW